MKKIEKLLELLKWSKFVKRKAVTKLVWGPSASSLIKVLEEQWHIIATSRTLDEVIGYRYEGYIMPFPKMARDIRNHYPELEKQIRLLYKDAIWK